MSNSDFYARAVRRDPADQEADSRRIVDIQFIPNAGYAVFLRGRAKPLLLQKFTGCRIELEITTDGITYKVDGRRVGFIQEPMIVRLADDPEPIVDMNAFEVI